MSTHPAKCRGCRGSGWQPGLPIVEVVQGRRHEYTTVQRCTHDWHRDDTGYDPHYDDPIAIDDPRAATASEAAYDLGQHDLWVLSGGRLGREHPNARKDGAA